MDKKTQQYLLEKVKKDYNEIADRFSKTRERKLLDWDILLNKLELDKTGLKVLDLGCGNGRFYKFLNEKWKKRNKKYKYIGLDITKKLLDIARNRYKNIEFIEGDIIDLPFKEEEFDIVFSFASLHHIPGDDLRMKALRRTRRVLKKRGKFVLSVWNLFQHKYQKYLRKNNVSRELRKKCDPYDIFIPFLYINRYYYAFTPQKIKNMLLRSGFKILEEIFTRRGKKVSMIESYNFNYICEKG